MAEEIRPPYVEFENRAVEDREASIAAGHIVYKDIVYAIVTPAGSKDKIERVADEWIQMLSEQAAQDRIPSDWVRQYKGALAEWREGREVPLEGTPILTWPLVTPAQQKIILDANIRTVEDLAAATEEAISYLGMGGRALKEKAVSFLKTAKDSGKVAEENAALRTEISSLRNELKTQGESMKTMEAELKKLQAK